MNAELMNGLSLAYIGDAVYELMIRKYFINQGFTKVKDLHKKVTTFTSGVQQAKVVHKLLNDNILSKEEENIFKRGRNSHISTSRRNIGIQDYLDATGFEALIGYLYLTGKPERIEQLLNIIFDMEKGESL